MAATVNAYYLVGRIAQNTGDYDNAVFTGTTPLASGDSATFKLRGGKYGVTVHATFSGGSATLQVLGQDGTTWLPALTAFSADGYATADLVEGQYRMHLA